MVCFQSPWTLSEPKERTRQLKGTVRAAPFAKFRKVSTALRDALLGKVRRFVQAGLTFPSCTHASDISVHFVAQQVCHNRSRLPLPGFLQALPSREQFMSRSQATLAEHSVAEVCCGRSGRPVYPGGDASTFSLNVEMHHGVPEAKAAANRLEFGAAAVCNSEP